MKITVFTPTYNRAYIIDKLYRSLQRQTYEDFEWLVVDDGSSDDTSQLFDTWQKEDNFFPIVYHKTENGGKHRAINSGVGMARGELFFIVDSDDYLTDDALGKVVEWYDGIEDKQQFCGVAGLRGYDELRPIGSTFKGTHLDASTLQREKNNIYGDKAEAFRTDIIRQFPFKEFYDEKFLTETTVWFEIAGAGYKIRWFNEIIYICNYLEDGLTRNIRKIIASNLEGTMYTVFIYNKYHRLTLPSRIALFSSICEIAERKGISRKEIALKLDCSVMFLKFACLIRKIKNKFMRNNEY